MSLVISFECGAPTPSRRPTRKLWPTATGPSSKWEEVAQLTGASADYYYACLEQGRAIGFAQGLVDRLFRLRLRPS